MPDPQRNFEAFAASLEQGGLPGRRRTRRRGGPTTAQASRQARTSCSCSAGTRTSSTRRTTSTSTSARKTAQFGFDNPSLFALLAKADAEPDPDKRAALYQQASVQVMKFLPVVPYVWAAGAIAFDSNMKGFVTEPGRARSTNRWPSSYVRVGARRRASSRRTTRCSASSSAGCCSWSRSCSGSRSSSSRWIRALPGSPAESLLGERATPQAVAQIRHQYGLDKPIYVQYWDYLKTIGERQPRHEHRDARARSRTSSSTGSRRRSSSRSRPCSSRSSLGIPLGLLAAKSYGSLVRPLQPRRVADRDLDPDLLPRADPQVRLRGQAAAGCRASGARTCSRRGRTRRTSTSSTRSSNGDPGAFWDAIKHLILPAIALGSIPLAIVTRITRASVLDVQNEDYVRTARAKGLPPRDRRPPARPPERAAADQRRSSACRPACCSRAPSSPRRSSPGPGIGSWLKEAIFNRDYPVLQGGILFLAVVFVVVNLLVDISYAIINPRIRLVVMSVAADRVASSSRSRRRRRPLARRVAPAAAQSRRDRRLRRSSPSSS